MQSNWCGARKFRRGAKALEVIGLFESAKNAMIFDKNALHIWLGDIKIDGMALKNFSRGANSW